MIVGESNSDFEMVVVGLGKTGLSCARFLSALGVAYAVTDSRTEPPGASVLARELPGVRQILGGFDFEMLEAANTIVLSPGVDPHSLPASVLSAGVEIIGDIELFARYAKAPIIAITGSNGKSTVTALLGEILSNCGFDVRVGGNFGTPALELLSEDNPDFYLLELSSFQLETTTSLRAQVAAILNISADHLDRHQDMARYIGAKQRIFQGDGVMVLNADDPSVSVLREPTRSCLCFSAAGASDAEFVSREMNGTPWLFAREVAVLPVSELGIRGSHNVANALAALALADVIGVQGASSSEVLRSFTGLTHRCQLVAHISGVDWIDDSKATNVGAARAAIEGLSGYQSIVLIAGGQGKGADFSPLLESAQGRVKAVVVLGEDASQIRDALADKLHVVLADSLADAVAQAGDLVGEGEAVLLSPACASHDMFKDFAARGREFATQVRGRLLQ